MRDQHRNILLVCVCVYLYMKELRRKAGKKPYDIPKECKCFKDLGVLPKKVEYIHNLHSKPQCKQLIRMVSYANIVKNRRN